VITRLSGQLLAGDYCTVTLSKLFTPMCTH